MEQVAQSIHKKGVSNRFKCHALDVIFWKANIDIGPLGGVLSRFNLDDHKSPLEVLGNFSQPISELWDRQPLESRLHVIAEIPAEGAPLTGTSQIPPDICLDLVCLLVKSDGTPIGKPFVLSEFENCFISRIAERIKDRRSDIPPDVLSDFIQLWKPDPPSSLPSGHPGAVNALHLNEPGSERGVMALDMGLQIGDYFAANQVVKGQIHVIAQLPLDRKNEKGKSRLLPLPEYTPAFEEEITFTIPSKTRFQSLKKADINPEEVESTPGEDMPPFLEKFYNDLTRRRCMPANVSAVAISLCFPSFFFLILHSHHPSNLFPRFGKSFSDYFRSQEKTDSVPDLVTESEIGQYMHVLLSRTMLSIDRFEVGKEGQIGVAFLHVVAGELIRRGDDLRACLTAWQFPILAVPQDGEPETTKFRYTPMNDFRLEAKNFSFCLLEVVSGKKAPLECQTDLWRMILQASCLARLGNKLRHKTDDPVVIMAIYIDSQLQAHEYLVYQPDISSKKVLYRETCFSLISAKESFEFIFRLYNLLTRVTDDSRNLKNPVTELDRIRNEIPENVYPSLTSGRGRKRKRDVDTGTDQQHAASSPLGEPSMQASLKEAGYELTPTDSMLVPITPLKPTMRDATSSDGVYVVLKVVDDDTDELAILKHLNEIKSEANHTIELHGIINNSIAKVIALRWRIPLDEYFRFHHPPGSAVSFPEQLLEGVAFLHEHRVAHLDLKPGNMVVKDLDRDRKRSPRLIIIDFGLSVFVEDEDTTIEGYCGTPPWVSPEVGTHDGPDMKYSPILADRWACGRILYYLEKLVGGGGHGSQGEMLKDRLMSADPSARPAVKEVLNTYRVSTKGGVKRIAKAEESDGTLKRARVNSASSID